MIMNEKNKIIIQFVIYILFVIYINFTLNLKK